MMNYSFDTPIAFLLLVFLPAYVAWYFIVLRKRRLKLRLSHNPKKLNQNQAIFKYLRLSPMISDVLAAIMMIIALARPQAINEFVEKSAEGIDIMLLLDTSGSMEYQDFKPDRLEVAKAKAKEFIKGRVDDRIGIVIFAEDALTYSPLTLDYKLLQEQIDDITPNILPKQGTAMGAAIGVGINRLIESPNPSKVMILITDGANNKGKLDPITAAKLAKKYKIKIYSIGIGKKEFVQYVPFQGNQVVKTDLDEKTLKKISQITGGEFFRSTNPSSLSNIFSEISKMEKTPITEEQIKDVQDKYTTFLFFALFFMGISVFLRVLNLYNPLED